MKGWRIVIDYNYDGGIVSLNGDDIIYLDKEKALNVLRAYVKDTSYKPSKHDEKYYSDGYNDVFLEEYSII